MVSEAARRRQRPQEVDVDRITLVQRAQLVAAAPDRCTGGPVTTIVFDADDFHDVADRLGSDAADRVLIDLADRLQARLCGCGVTTHLSHHALGIDCVGLTAEDRVDRDVALALAVPLELAGGLVEVRAS
jgi:predicted signal transduction protein with EAL and GGDEF domain